MDVSKDKFSLGSHTAYVKEKREYVEDELTVIWEPVYERYEKDEILLDENGDPVAEMEQVPVFEERKTSYVTSEKEPVAAAWDPVKKEHKIYVENVTDWSGKTEAIEENFRAETRKRRSWSLEWKFPIISILPLWELLWM